MPLAVARDFGAEPHSASPGALLRACEPLRLHRNSSPGFPGGFERRSRIAAVFLLTFLLVAIALSACSKCHETEPMQALPELDPLLLENRAVAHALGGIDGIAYSNSLNAFRHSVELGFKIVEVDLMLVEGELICFHEGNEGQLTWRGPEDAAKWPQEYGLARYAGRFRIISARELLQALDRVEGVYLVTDTKGDNAEVLQRLVELAREINEGLVTRIIPQIFLPSEVAAIETIAPFPRVILTLYSWDSSDAEVLEAVQRHRFAAVTMPPPRVSADFVAELRALGVLSYVHTVNDADVIRELLEKGVHGVYTDSDTSLLEAPYERRD